MSAIKGLMLIFTSNCQVTRDYCAF